jgi:hypothetical protein
MYFVHWYKRNGGKEHRFVVICWCLKSRFMFAEVEGRTGNIFISPSRNPSPLNKPLFFFFFFSSEKSPL